MTWDVDGPEPPSNGQIDQDSDAASPADRDQAGREAASRAGDAAELASSRPDSPPDGIAMCARPPRQLASQADAERHLRDAETGELARIEGFRYNADRKRYGPALATAVDRGNVGADGAPAVFQGRNLGEAFDPNDLHPTLRRRRDAYIADAARMAERRIFTDGVPVDGDPGHHAEVQAVNAALHAREAAGLPTGDAALTEILVSVRRVKPKPGQSGDQFGCCNDCAHLLTSPNSVAFTADQQAANAEPEGDR